jgi:hypothetical protein
VQGVVGGRGGDVGRAVARRPRRSVVVGDGDLPSARRAQRRRGQAVPEQLVMRGRKRVDHQRPAGRVHAERIPERGHDERLVESDPQRHAIGEPSRGDAGEVGEPVRGIPRHPAARVLQRLRQVPVKQRRHRGDPARQQAIDQSVVEVEPGFVGRARSGRLDARPRQREPVGANAERGHQRHVFWPPVVVVVGDIAGVTVPDRAGPTAEGVPDRLTAAVCGNRALDLIRGRSKPPR